MYPKELIQPLQEVRVTTYTLLSSLQFRLITGGWVDDLPGVLHG